MKDYTQDELRARFKTLGMTWWNFHLIGIRNIQDAPNVFDDVFYLVSNGQVVAKYTGTTNPGVDWLMTFFNPGWGGTAVLASDNQYVNSWILGKHRGTDAWIQSSPVLVFRDNNKNDKSEEIGIPIPGLYGIDIHHANDKFISKINGKWSAGCQVFNDPAQHADFMAKSVMSKQKFFTYTLLKEF